MAAKKPNIFLIMTDQHRADTMPYMRARAVPETPALASLARSSVCFPQAYTTCPVCTPARSSLYTGLYPSRTGMCTNIYNAGCETNELADRPFLLSRRLEAAGYACGYTGKWHLGLGKDKASSFEGRKLLKRMERGDMCGDAYLGYGTLPTDVGFTGDDFPGHGDGGWETPQFEAYLKARGLTLKMEDKYGHNLEGYHSRGAIITSGIETTVEHFLVERAISIVDALSSGSAPFFMSLNFWGPHEPYYVPKEYYEKYRGMKIDPWESFAAPHRATPGHRVLARPLQDWAFFEENLRRYYAYIEYMDYEIGRFIAHLREKGLYDDGVVLFTADHGDSQGCHGGLENKAYHMYEETVKIPMMVKVPGGTGGRLCDALVGTCDVYATILDAAGLHDPAEHQCGESMLPYVEKPDTQGRRGIMTEGVGAFPVIATQRMYREGAYKYIFNFAGTDELYDLARDPHELKNLADDAAQADTLSLLRMHMYENMLAHGDPCASMFAKIYLIGPYADIP